MILRKWKLYKHFGGGTKIIWIFKEAKWCCWLTNTGTCCFQNFDCFGGTIMHVIIWMARRINDSIRFWKFQNLVTTQVWKFSKFIVLDWTFAYSFTFESKESLWQVGSQKFWVEKLIAIFNTSVLIGAKVNFTLSNFASHLKVINSEIILFENSRIWQEDKNITIISALITNKKNEIINEITCQHSSWYVLPIVLIKLANYVCHLRAFHNISVSCTP